VSQSSASCVAVSSIGAAPFSSTSPTESDNSSRKLRLRCGCQFRWCALARTPAAIPCSLVLVVRQPLTAGVSMSDLVIRARCNVL
jgi:hypothetical protein